MSFSGPRTQDVDFPPMAFALVGLSTGTVTTAAAGAAAAAHPVVPALTQVSATHRAGYDELVFQFRGGVPAKYSARYVSQVIRDASGLPVNVVGSALLQVRFTPAAGHNEKGIVTYGAMQRTYAQVTWPATAFGAMQRSGTGAHLVPFSRTPKARQLPDGSEGIIRTVITGAARCFSAGHGPQIVPRVPL